MSCAVCQQCGSTVIDVDATRGVSVCVNCGCVLSENAIVAEVEFQETGAGGHSVIGQYVSAENPGKLYMGGMGLHGRESREITLQAGKRKIVEMASQLRLNQHCIDMAFNYFKMAVARGITKGRRSPLVNAACLYITCRMEGTPHLLLDFCDVLQANVFELGKVFNFLARSLYINLPPTDPCIYVMRFAHALNFGDKEHEVTLMALRLVQRMKRDWMGIGRRPTGLCGASLLLAARYHNFNCAISDIVRVVNIGEAVVRKRLQEFEMTPSSALTLDEFQTVDLEESADPPAFVESKRKAKIHQTEVEALRLDAMKGELLSYEKEVEAALQERARVRKTRFSKGPSRESRLSITSLDIDLGDPELPEADSFLQEEILSGVLDSSDASGSIGQRYKCHAPTLASLGLCKIPVEADSSNVIQSTNCNALVGSAPEDSGGNLDMTGIDDSELDSYILTANEVSLKTKIWMAENEQFLLDREELRKKRQQEESERLAKDGESAVKKRRRRRLQQQPAATAGEAIEKIIQERRLSSKINYEVLKNLSVDGETCGTSAPSASTPESSDKLAFSAISEPIVLQQISSPSSESSTSSSSDAIKRRLNRSAIKPNVQGGTTVKKVDFKPVNNSMNSMPPPQSPAPKRSNHVKVPKMTNNVQNDEPLSTASLVRSHQDEIYGPNSESVNDDLI